MHKEEGKERKMIDATVIQKIERGSNMYQYPLQQTEKDTLFNAVNRRVTDGKVNFYESLAIGV